MTVFEQDQGDLGDGWVWGPDPAVLPAGVEDLPVDWFLAAALDGVVPDELGAHDRVRLLAAYDRLVSHFQALRVGALISVGEAVGWSEFTAVEIAPALHLTNRAADGEVGDAIGFNRLPDVLAQLAAGTLDWRRARAVVEAVEHLDDDMARRVVDDVAGQLADLTTGQIRSRIRRRCLSLDAGDATRRLEQRLTQRRTAVYANPQGTATFVLADVAPDRATAAMDRIDALARHLPADGRTADQRRADVALDLLCGHGPAVGRGTVDITVDLTTLIGLDEHPGTVGGWGPVIAEIARSLAEAQRDVPWQATVTGPDGTVHTTALRRRPTADQARAVRARHPRCVFPGCRMPARATDLDHQHGGPTLPDNLAPLCRRHHRAKHEAGWTYRVDQDGTVHWTSPTGHHYTNPTRGP